MQSLFPKKWDLNCSPRGVVNRNGVWQSGAWRLIRRWLKWTKLGLKINTTKMQDRLERKLFKTAYFSVSVCVLGLAVCFCKFMCIYFHNTVAMRAGTDVIQRIFSFTVFSSSPSAALREGPGPAETTTVSIHLSNVNCLITHSSPVLVCVCAHVWMCLCFCICCYNNTGNGELWPSRLCKHALCLKHVGHYQ